MRISDWSSDVCSSDLVFCKQNPIFRDYEAGCGLNPEVSSMSLGQAIAPHLPYLRRYGRAISGSQTSGDALVARLLQTLVADPDAVDTGARSEEHTSELQSLMRNSYAVFCLKKKKNQTST